MRILILTAATGGGHIRASRAIEAYLSEHMPGSQTRVVDALKCVNTIFDKTICDGYHFLATKQPKVFGKLYETTNRETPLSRFVPLVNNIVARKLLPTVQEFNPDIILTTHPFVNEMGSQLKEKEKIHQPLICILTDYSPHRTWVAKQVDAYVVASEDMVPQLVEMGAPREKIHPFGIPVFSQFFSQANKDELLREFGLDTGVHTVLFMAGSFGVNNILQIYRDVTALPDDFQLIVITGRNQKLFDALEKEVKNSPKKTKLIFFTNEVEKYMKVSDLIVTKPGGLTVSEALACNLPLAVFDAIPGQEEENADFLLSHDMAVHMKKGDDCAKAIQLLLRDEERLDRMRRSCERFDKSQSIPHLMALMENLTQGEKE